MATGTSTASRDRRLLRLVPTWHPGTVTIRRARSAADPWFTAFNGPDGTWYPSSLRLGRRTWPLGRYGRVDQRRPRHVHGYVHLRAGSSIQRQTARPKAVLFVPQRVRLRLPLARGGGVVIAYSNCERGRASPGLSSRETATARAGRREVECTTGLGRDGDRASRTLQSMDVEPLGGHHKRVGQPGTVPALSREFGRPTRSASRGQSRIAQPVIARRRLSPILARFGWRRCQGSARVRRPRNG